MNLRSGPGLILKSSAAVTLSSSLHLLDSDGYPAVPCSVRDRLHYQRSALVASGNNHSCRVQISVDTSAVAGRIVSGDSDSQRCLAWQAFCLANTTADVVLNVRLCPTGPKLQAVRFVAWKPV